MSLEEKLLTVAAGLEEINEGIILESELINELQSLVDNMPTDNGGVYDAGYADGQQAQHDAFWENYLARTRKDGFAANLFAGPGWNENTKFPFKIDFATNIYQMFTYSGNIPKNEMAKIDFSNATSGNNAFSYSTVKELPELNFSKMGSVQATFASASYLVSIDKIILKEDGSQIFTNAFNNCSNLTEVRFEGTIGQNIDFRYSKRLSKESITSIINTLSATTSGMSITLAMDAVDNAFWDKDGEDVPGSTSAAWNELIKTKPNWTISLV